MSISQALFLGILQGIAEFLPISSSGHLAVAQELFSLNDIPLLFDIFLHLATLAAVIVFFRKKILSLFAGMLCYEKKDLAKQFEPFLSTYKRQIAVNFW